MTANAYAAEPSRFPSNPFVLRTPRIRTYVGHPVGSADSVRLGTNCLIDTRSRVITPQTLVSLRGVCAI